MPWAGDPRVNIQSDTFNVRIGEHLHRDLAMNAAEQHMSLNQFVVKKLAAG